MNLPPVDQTKEQDTTFEGESVRLSNELRAKPAHTELDFFGNRIDIPAKRGFDVETADFTTMVNYLADTRIKKSESSIAFIHRILSVRFPNEYAQNKINIENRYKLEVEMIESKSKNDVTWLGEVGFQNMVRLDDTLTNPRNRVVKGNNDDYRIVRK